MRGRPAGLNSSSNRPLPAPAPGSTSPRASWSPRSPGGCAARGQEGPAGGSTRVRSRALVGWGGNRAWARRIVVDVGSVTAHGRHCIARHEGTGAVRAHTAPGSRSTRITGTGPGGRFGYADAVEILTHRARPAPCPYAGPASCGTAATSSTSLWRRNLEPEGGGGRGSSPVGPARRRRDRRAVGSRTRAALADPRRVRRRPAGRAGLRAHRSRGHPVGDCLIAARVVGSGVLGGDWSGTAAVDVAARAAVTQSSPCPRPAAPSRSGS